MKPSKKSHDNLLLSHDIMRILESSWLVKSVQVGKFSSTPKTRFSELEAAFFKKGVLTQVHKTKVELSRDQLTAKSK